MESKGASSDSWEVSPQLRLEEGRISDASLEGAFKMLAHEFFDEEEEQYTEKERWISRKQKLDVSQTTKTFFVNGAEIFCPQSVWRYKLRLIRIQC